MANPFDQFDDPRERREIAAASVSPPAVEVAGPAQANPFDAFDPAPVGVLDAVTRGVAQGGTLGFGDEIFAAGAGVRSWQRGEGFGPGYDRALAEYRRDDRAAREQRPYTMLAGEVAGGVAPAFATAGTDLAGTAATTTARLFQGAKIGAATGGVMGFGQAEDGFVNRALEAGKGALVGGALGTLAEGAVAGSRALGRQAREVFYPNATTAPTLTPEASAILREAGFDPARIGDEAATAILARAQQAGGLTPATARQAGAGEFNVPLTRGQATADVGQSAFEEAARADARGQVAGNVLRGFDQQQGAALSATRDDLQRGFAGEGHQIIGGAREAGESVTSALREAEAQASTRIGEAYREAGMRGASVKAEGLAGLSGRARQALDDAAFVVDPQLTPATTRALAELDGLTNLRSMAEGRGVRLAPGDEVAGISLDGLETTRRRINSLFDTAQTKGDREGLRRVKQAFDQHIDEAFDKALLSGDEAALARLKEARGLRAEYGARFERQGAGDDAGGIINRILQRDVQPNEVANWMLGNVQLGASPRSVRFAERVRDIVGLESQAWADIRQGAWTRLTAATEGRTQPSAQAQASGIAEFVNGKGRDLAEVLFTGAERQQMERYAATLRATVPPPRSTNPSGTGYEVARAASPWLGRVAGGLGLVGSGGSPAAAGALSTAANALRSGSNTLRAGRSIQPITAPQSVNAVAAALSGVAGSDQRAMVLGAANDRTREIARLLAGSRY